MAYSHPKLRANQRCRHGGVHVAINENEVRSVFEQARLKSRNDLCRLLRVAARADLQVHMRRRDTQFLEKHVRHVEVVVLSRVKQDLVRATGLQRLEYGRYLHKIRTGSDYVKDLHDPERPEQSRRSGTNGVTPATRIDGLLATPANLFNTVNNSFSIQRSIGQARVLAPFSFNDPLRPLLDQAHRTSLSPPSVHRARKSYPYVLMLPETLYVPQQFGINAASALLD